MPVRPPSQNIRLAAGVPEGWEPARLNYHGLDGFNRVELIRQSQPVMTILDNPLLVTGRYKYGRTLAFTGFTPEYVETRANRGSSRIPLSIGLGVWIRPQGTIAFLALYEDDCYGYWSGAGNTI